MFKDMKFRKTHIFYVSKNEISIYNTRKIIPFRPLTDYDCALRPNIRLQELSAVSYFPTRRLYMQQKIDQNISLKPVNFKFCYT